MSKLTHSRTSVHNIGYHIVWSTKYRKPVLVDDISVSLKNILIETIEVMPDHVHLFVRSNPKTPPNYIYKMLKGISATKLFLIFPNLKNSLYNGNLWNPSTFIESVGHISEDLVKKYIEGQKKYESN